MLLALVPCHWCVCKLKMNLNSTVQLHNILQHPSQNQNVEMNSLAYIGTSWLQVHVYNSCTPIMHTCKSTISCRCYSITLSIAKRCVAVHPNNVTLHTAKGRCMKLQKEDAKNCNYRQQLQPNWVWLVQFSTRRASHLNNNRRRKSHQVCIQQLI